MSTAIARFYTPEGFVIAADGRKRDAESHSIVNDNTQKIFGLSGMLLAAGATVGWLIAEFDGEALHFLRSEPEY